MITIRLKSGDPHHRNQIHYALQFDTQIFKRIQFFLAICAPENPKMNSDQQVGYLSQMFAMQQLLLLHTQSQIMQSLQLQSDDSTKQQQLIIRYLQQIVSRGQIVTIMDHFPTMNMNIIVKLIANVVLHVVNSLPELEKQQFLISQYEKEPLSIILCQAEWNLITELLEKRLVILLNRNILCTNESCQQIISKTLLFNQQVKNTIFKKLHSFSLGRTDGVVPQLVLSSLSELLSLEHRNPEFLFKLLSQEGSSDLSREHCSKSLTVMFNQINNYYRNTNLIEQIIEDQKKFETRVNLERFAQSYLRHIELYQRWNKQKLLDSILECLFQEDSINQDQFVASSEQLPVDLKNILFMLLNLMKLENSIINLVLADRTSESPLRNPLDYYAKLIDKLKNKCIVKEDENCDCKKCQCIRRNRDSAREAQKRKREALERIGPLQEEYEKLQKKVKVIESRNSQLKKLLLDVCKHPAVSQLVLDSNIKLQNYESYCEGTTLQEC